jgi:adenylate cyclase
MGDAVNLGSRLEGLTRTYGVNVLIGQDTRTRLADWVCREVDRVRVKGKHEPVAIYEPIGPRGEVSAQIQAQVDRWDEMLSLLRRGQWSDARQVLQDLERDDPGRTLYRLYAQRLDRLEAEPPAPDWDGVTTFDTK